MSLSPLYAAHASDLHVNIAAGLHQAFAWLRRGHVKITSFRVYRAPLGCLRCAVPWCGMTRGAR